MKIVRTLRKLKKMTKGKIKKCDSALRWGIIGTGYMAEQFGTALDGNMYGIVAAVASRTLEKAQRFSKQHCKCKAYGSYAEMLKDESLDVIYIATPVMQHYENIKMCLLAKKNVLCEKPIVLSLEQLDELKSIAEKQGCFLMEGMWMKCLPTYQKALEWVQEGVIGDVDLIKADFYKREIVDADRAIFNKAEGGGVLRDYGIYAISVPIDFMKNEIFIQSHSRNSSFGVDSDWMIHINDGHAQAFINISSNFKGISKAAVIGDKGVIEWEGQFNRANTINLFDKYGKQIKQYKVQYEYEGFEYEINEVFNSIHNGKKESTKVSLCQSRKAIKILNELLESITTDSSCSTQIH